MSGTNNRGIDSIVEKAAKRADWYRTKYPKVKDLEKKAFKQFKGVIDKWRRTHTLTDEQYKYLNDMCKAAF